jgi:hypothetical protein
MQDLRPENKEIVLKINAEELTPTQVRLLKSVNSLLAHVLSSDEESEYFEASAELMKKVAETIKHAEYAQRNKKMEYGTQAVEYAIDFINESLDQDKLHNIDN